MRSLNLIMLKVINHPLYGMNNYVLICVPLRGLHDNFDLFVTNYSYYIRGYRSPLMLQNNNYQNRETPAEAVNSR